MTKFSIKSEESHQLSANPGVDITMCGYVERKYQGTLIDNKPTGP